MKKSNEQNLGEKKKKTTINKNEKMKVLWKFFYFLFLFCQKQNRLFQFTLPCVFFFDSFLLLPF